jgi:hypothetical protein
MPTRITTTPIIQIIKLYSPISEGPRYLAITIDVTTPLRPWHTNKIKFHTEFLNISDEIGIVI